MSRIFTISIAILLLLSTACDRAEPTVDMSDELAKIESVLEKYVMANENKDFSLIEQIWCENDKIVLIGTDSDEQFVGWEPIKAAIQHQFAEFEDTYISVLDQKIQINETGNTAWFSEFLNYNFIYKGEAKSFEGIRFTGVLVKKNDQWVLVQGHLSIPVKEGTELGQN